MQKQKTTKIAQKAIPQKSPTYLQHIPVLKSIIATSERVSASIESKSMVMPQRQKKRLLKNHAKRITLAHQLIKTIQFDD